MKERMELDGHKTGSLLLSSRDPRLASHTSKPPTIRTTSVDKRAPNSAIASPCTPKPATPSTAQKSVDSSPCVNKHDNASNNSTGGSLAQAISGLVQASVAAAMSKLEKEKLQRKKDNTENLLKKAGAHMKYPSTADFFRQATNDENMDLARLDRAINEHLSISNQIEKDLVRKWGTLSSTDSKSEEMIKGLQNELRVAKSDIAKSNTEIARLASLVDTGPSSSGPVKVLQDRVILLEKSVGQQGSIIAGQAKDAKETERRLTLLNSEIKKDMPPSQPQLSQETLNRIDTEIETLKHQSSALDSGLKAQVTYQEQIRKAVEQTKTNMEIQQQKSTCDNALESLQKKMDVFHHHLTILERKAASPSTPQMPHDDTKVLISNLESRLRALEGSRFQQNVASPQITNNSNEREIQKLSQQIHEMTRLQAMKDDLQFGDMETIKETLAKQNEEFQGLGKKLGQLSEDLKSVGKANPRSPSNNQFQSLSTSLQNTQRVMETLKVGLHSLETRYNSITTEPIVKNMVVAMQELYPSASQLTEQVNILRGVFEKEFIPLRSNVDQLIRAYSTHTSRAQNETRIIQEELGRLKDGHARMEKSLQGVWDRTTTLESWPGHQHFLQLQSTCENLSNYVDERISRINEQLKSSQETDDDFRQRLNNERENFEKEHKQLSNELKEMGRKFSKIDMANMENFEATKTQWQDISSLLDRVQDLENSAAKNHEQLLLQFDHIKKSKEDREPDMESESLPQSPQPKVEANEEDEQTITSTPNSNSTFRQVAESDPALALQKKKKRPRLMNSSDDERSSSCLRESTSSEKKKSKKKKQKCRDPETITLD